MTFRFAVISDLHLAVDIRRRNILSVWDRLRRNRSDVSRSASQITPRPGSFRSFLPATYDDVPLGAAQDFLRRFNDDIELLVVLGDLAATGMYEDLLVAQRVVLGAGARPGEICLAGVCQSKWLLPGNHDRYIDINGEPGSNLFEAIFNSVYRPTKRVNVACFANVSVAFISADFSLPFGKYLGDTRRWGRGLVDKETLDELVVQTANLKEKNPDVCIVWTVHFSPAHDVPDLLMLEGRQELLSAARNLDVDFILCGHTHNSACYSTGSKPTIVCAGTVSEVDAEGRHFLHVGELHRDPVSGGRKLKWFDFKYSETEKEFKLEGKHDLP